ncbi:MAG TPA: hypothetical protein VFV39_01380, partial [Limnobacter sp.]|nr:hypothetical protein [Limnobacter sp.]
RSSLGVQPPDCIDLDAGWLEQQTGLRVFDLRISTDARAAVNSVQGKARVRLIHPWDLAATEESTSPGQAKVALLDAGFHECHGWSRARWQFVNEGLSRCEAVWIADSRMCARDQDLKAMFNQTKAEFDMLETLNPGYVQLSRCLPLTWLHEPRILPNPARFQQSFSRFYQEAANLAGNLDKALNMDAASIL